MSTTPLLHLQHLQKNFGHFRALKDVTFDVYPGEVFGFIGPNGAGKSTTIRILLGLIRASGGTATLFGRPVWQDSVQIHQRLAYVPGDVYLWPDHRPAAPNERPSPHDSNGYPDSPIWIRSHQEGPDLFQR